jgi:hypothetical protein
VREAVPVKHPDGVVQSCPRRDGETHVIQTDAVLVEAIAARRSFRVWMRPDAEANRAVAEKRTGVEIHQLVEAQDFGVELHRAIYVADGEPKVMDTLGSNPI